MSYSRSRYKNCKKKKPIFQELPVRVPWLCAYLATQPLLDFCVEEVNRIKIRLVNVIETLSAQQYFEAACGSLAELLRRAIFNLSEAEKVVASKMLVNFDVNWKLDLFNCLLNFFWIYESLGFL